MGLRLTLLIVVINCGLDATVVVGASDTEFACALDDVTEVIFWSEVVEVACVAKGAGDDDDDDDGEDFESMVSSSSDK